MHKEGAVVRCANLKVPVCEGTRLIKLTLPRPGKSQAQESGAGPVDESTVVTVACEVRCVARAG